MASFAYTYGLGKLNTTVLTGDIRALLVMSNTTADTDEDAQFIIDDQYFKSLYFCIHLIHR